MNTKRTEKEILKEILELVKDNQEYSELLTKKIKNLEKKRVSKKELEKQELNKELATKALDFLTGQGSDKKFTAKEIGANVEELNNLTTQKITAILSILFADNKIKKEVIKKVTHYSIVD